MREDEPALSLLAVQRTELVRVLVERLAINLARAAMGDHPEGEHKIERNADVPADE